MAIELGYDDYPYCSRLFTRTAGMVTVAFRSKNLGLVQYLLFLVLSSFI